MLLMATPKKGKRGRPRKYPDAEEGPRSGVAINFRIDPELHALLPTYQALFLRQHKVRLDKTGVVEKALRELYQRAGLLPQDDAGLTPSSH